MSRSDILGENPVRTQAEMRDDPIKQPLGRDSGRIMDDLMKASMPHDLEWFESRIDKILHWIDPITGEIQDQEVRHNITALMWVESKRKKAVYFDTKEEAEQTK